MGTAMAKTTIPMSIIEVNRPSSTARPRKPETRRALALPACTPMALVRYARKAG